MKKFSRCVLILILVTILSGVGGYFYEDKNITPMYTSTAKLYVVPGTDNEASVRASNGGLNNDFMIIFKSNVVISDAQKTLGTSEDIAQYLTVKSPDNSNIVEITCTNPDQKTAKAYVDAIAKTAIKTTSIIPVKSIQILSEGTSSNEVVKPDLYRNTLIIGGVGAGICLIFEIIIVLILSAFKKNEDHSDDEFEYEKYYGKFAKLSMNPTGYIDAKQHTKDNTSKNEVHSINIDKDRKYVDTDMHDILEDFDEDFDEDYAQQEDENDETVGNDTMPNTYSQIVSDVAVSDPQPEIEKVPETVEEPKVPEEVQAFEAVETPSMEKESQPEASENITSEQVDYSIDISEDDQSTVQTVTRKSSTQILGRIMK
jgi:capsular polysaccharide biosynthesis protein